MAIFIFGGAALAAWTIGINSFTAREKPGFRLHTLAFATGKVHPQRQNPHQPRQTFLRPRETFISPAAKFF
ncbi:hypothetical protein IQ265_11655 [Nodosilinea sp. LEGE 06152]|uniref:hypothetical protein n=1 Tax=Nodosilinea sp. LEGE 06152 TaxID=2777966 RepID=UPI0018827232|nr:hypothetical protein [Nodosilinea sp. LEGE 06152]MBE9157473.1 hypothetical protein [Nodosilinea sp. LEGE 06152]